MPCIWYYFASLLSFELLIGRSAALTAIQTGAGTTASRLGMADLGIASRTDMKEHADMIANLDSSKILIADMDTGYGGKSRSPQTWVSSL